MYTQDINELTISGHVTQPPQHHGDPDDEVYRFVLCHCTYAYDRSGWEQQHYSVTAYGKLGELFAIRHQPGQVIVVMGELDIELQDTLIGALPAVSITAHRIITVDGQLNPAASAAAPARHVELQQTAIGPVPHPPTSRQR